jgi:hypothetical protein
MVGMQGMGFTFMAPAAAFSYMAAQQGAQQGAQQSQQQAGLLAPADPRRAFAAATDVPQQAGGAAFGAGAGPQAQGQLGQGMLYSNQAVSEAGGAGLAGAAEAGGGAMSTMDLMSILQAAGVAPVGQTQLGGTQPPSATDPTAPSVGGLGAQAGQGVLGAGGMGQQALGGQGAEGAGASGPQQAAQHGVDISSQLLALLGGGTFGK